MVDHADIKADLPQWPDDVIDQWLRKLANRGPDTGWPPPEPWGNSSWKYILGRRPLSWWQNVTWNLEQREVNFGALSQGTKRIVNNMIDGHINGHANLYSADSDVRFRSALGHIAKNGVLPRPLVAMQLKDGISVIDGNHRVAALCACQAGVDEIAKKGGVAPQKIQQVWIGTHSDGEAPHE
jgi:hypothetical protein